jgi:iron complex outermembrane recepter protein
MSLPHVARRTQLGEDSMNRLLLTAACSLLGIAALAAAPAYAESAGSNANEGATELGEVVVTAQRREERAVDVPITITSISADQLAQDNIQQISDIATVTPALRFDRENAWVQPTIRGVGTAVTTSGGGANVGIYVDGFYSPNPLAAEFDLLNVTGVQVLKGPQGTLFGRNTTGGAILVSTAKPSTQDAALVEASYGRFNTQRYRGYATMGLTDKVAVDIEGLLSKGDGHQTEILTDNSKIGHYENSTMRVGLNYDFSDKTSFLLRFAHLQNNDPSGNLPTPFLKDGVPWTNGPIFVPGAAAPTNPDQVALNGPLFNKTENDIAQLAASFDLGYATLQSYTQYRRLKHQEGADLDGSGAPLFNILIPVDSKTVSQEFLLSSNPGPKLQWTTGLFYFSDDDRWHDIAGAQGGGPFATFASSNTKTISLAGFFDGTYTVTPQFFVTAGLRYSRDKIEDAYFHTPTPPTFAFVRTDLPTLSSSRASPRVVLRYKPTDQSSVYASFTKGYKAPIYNVGGNATTPVDAESINSIEAGYKYAASKLTFDLSAYHYSYKNLQVASYNGTQSLINNAATASVKGAETSIRYQIMQGLEASLSAAYTDAKYDDYRNSPGVYYPLLPQYLAAGKFTPAAVAAAGLDPTLLNSPLSIALLSLAGTTVNASGNQMQRAPKVTGNLGLSYTTNAGTGKLGLSGNLYHTSSFFFDSSNQLQQDGYDLLGLRVDWTNASDRVMIALSGDNVTNKRYRLSGNEGQGLALRSVWAYPSMYMASVRVKF